jgi:endonuclease/exonuclease/phosphatase family metal-dependent hydrolase
MNRKQNQEQSDIMLTNKQTEKNRWMIGCCAALGLLLVHPPCARSYEPLPYEGKPLIEDAIPAISAPSDAPAIAGDRIRVAFYNIEMFTDGIKDGKNRTEELAINQARGAAAIIKELDADILLISEIENERALKYVNDALAHPFPRGYIVEFGTGGGRKEKMNIGMLSRFAPETVHEIDFGPLKGEGRPTRGVFRASFDLGASHHLLLYATHLKANWGHRQKNYAQRYNAMSLIHADAASMIEAFPDRQWEILILGDFNTDPRLPEFKEDPTLSRFKDWHDAWTEYDDRSAVHTVPTRRGDPMREFPPATFDRVLAHPGLREAPWSVSAPSVLMKGTETEDVTVLPGQGRHVSDHYPIYIDLTR